VRPPADMLGEAARRPSWAQGAEEPIAAAPAPGSGPSGTAADFELPGIELEAEVEAEASTWEAEPEIEIDTTSAFDFESLPTFPPELEPEPATGLAGEWEGAKPLEASPEELKNPTAAEDVELSLPAVDAGFDFGDELALEPLPDLEPPPAVPVISPPPTQPPTPPPPPTSHSTPSALQFDPDVLERTAAELHPQIHQREEDLVTEAEVLAKYGLDEKALDRLREALKVNPRHLPAHALAVQLQLDKGRHPKVVELANQMAKAAAEVADRDPWLKVRRRLLNAGYRLDGDQVLSGPSASSPTPSAVPTPPAVPVPPAVPPAPAAAPPPRTAKGVDDLLRGLLGKESPRRPAAKRDPVSPPPRPAPEPPEPPGIPISPAPPTPPIAPAPAPAAVSMEPPPPPPASPVPPVRVAPAAPAPGQTFNLLEIGEMVENEDMDSIDFPMHFPPSVAIPPPPSPPALAAASLDDTGMSWLDEAEAGRGKQEDRGDQLFADEDDFFDLAGELEQELSREEGLRGSDLLVQPAEQSLEQIVEGFKKGVAENLSPTDFDTHFNLGIAYREMGLLDEAIGEFQLASKSPSLLVACCSMLGLCFLDKGLPELAIKWYRRGLESPNVSEDDSLGLLYDMGNVYDSQGDIDTAYKTFVEIYGINTNYRDVVARIEELGRGR
jgi:tetratricopeptide (TPR) repeat protein